MMGMIISSYDIAATILTPLISYIGGSRKKPLFCAWGLIAMGVGFYIFMLPHFVSPPLEATGRCTRMGKFRVNKSTNFSSFILFSIFSRPLSLLFGFSHTKYCYKRTSGVFCDPFSFILKGKTILLRQ